MAVAVSFLDVWTDGKRIHAIGTLTFSGNYAAGGDAVNIAGAAQNNEGQGWRSPKDPLMVRIVGKSGYAFEYDRSAKKVKVRTGAAAGTALTELAAAAYPAGVTGDSVEFYAVGKRV